MSAPSAMYCFRPFMTTSSGIWLGDNPLKFTFPLLLFQISLIFTVTRITHFFLRRLDLPLIISQIVGGMLLGPSVLGRSMTYLKLLFPRRSFEQLDTVGLLSYILFVFVIGVKTDVGMIRKSGRKAVAIAAFSTSFPCLAAALSYQVAVSVRPSYAENWFYFVFLLSTQWSPAPYPVICTALEEQHLLTSQLGRLAVSAALIGNFFFLFVSGTIGAVKVGADLKSPLMALANLALFAGLWLFILVVARPTAMWMVRRTPEGRLLEEGYFLTVMTFAVVASLMSEMMGYHLGLGPFILGLMLPGGEPLGATMVERLDRLSNGVFLPVFTATVGLRMDIRLLGDVTRWGFAATFLVIITVAKLVGVMVPCLYCKMSLKDSFTVGLMLNIRGIVELDRTNEWIDSEVVDRQIYTVVVLAVILLGGGIPPLIKYLYRPEDRFVSHRRRTVQHTKCTEELRVLACFHNQDNVGPIAALLSPSHRSQSALCVYVLHLIQLVGRTATLLVPYKHAADRAGAGTGPTAQTNHIVNALRSLEEHNPGRISVLPFVCISPYKTMHEDVCSLALDKKAVLVILPFHRRLTLAGGVESAGAAVRAMNMNVLTYAPCSVAILIDHGHGLAFSDGGGTLVQHVGVYFFGGADDRETLAYAVRVAEDPAVGLTVLHFRLPKEQRRSSGKEGMLDEAALAEFRDVREDGKRVIYKEEVVKDVEGTVQAIRSMSGEFSLVMVGRREGHESTLTAGLSMWSEYPELGAVGDLLASTDFAGWVSTLVIQQQRRYIAGWHGDSPKAGSHTVNQVVPATAVEEEEEEEAVVEE